MTAASRSVSNRQAKLFRFFLPTTVRTGTRLNAQKFIFIFNRRDVDDLLTVMLCDDNSQSESSSDEDDLDFLLLSTLFPEPKQVMRCLNLVDLTESQCETMFRFQKDDMELLLKVLEIPAMYICSQRTVATGMKALMILLRRLVYPNRWCDLVDVFGRSNSDLSLIFSKVNE
ncbi:PREDICTED: uncharacterized protein LOC107348667 [Acropora digitifera]|uniref:uncharacterized protein LOC107348667 n=1 Tax=Acropora digitifera TaxID=70779 RepID=UPI00077AAF3F|nr:PREDICTED: uncharacterized protein LOC107348667 [Acropora digitifera]